MDQYGESRNGPLEKINLLNISLGLQTIILSAGQDRHFKMYAF